MNNNSWQHPFVNIFKHFDINSSKKCVKQGDISSLMDRDLKSTVYRIRGLIPANNYIQFPSQSSNPNLSLTGHLFYVLFRPIFDKYFCIHIDILTHEQHLIRISISNLYREFKVAQASIQFPYMTTGTDIHWSVLCLDLKSILLTYMTHEHFHLIKSFQLCGNLFVKNCFTSQFLYEPGVDNDTAKRTGLTRAGILSLPRELSYPIVKGESWHDKYDFIMFPNTSSLMGKSQNEPFDKVGNVRLPTPRKLNSNDRDLNQVEETDEILPLTVQTTLVNGQISRSITDLAHITQRSISQEDKQLNWRTYDNPVNRFSSLPVIDTSTIPSHPTNEGTHVFVNPPPMPTSSSITDDSNYDLALTTENPPQSQLRILRPDPILRLRTAIGLNSLHTSLLWTHDGNFVLYPSNSIVVQMHVESQEQWFFIGHTDKISALAFNPNSLLLATTQTGPNAILRLWNFDTRRCLCAIRVPNTHDLHALDFGMGKASSSLVLVGHDEQSRTVVCVYNASKGSLELICRATTDASITHLRFVPYDTSKFLSIGLDNILFWHIKNENDFKSISLSTDDINQLRFTSVQFESLSNNRFNELLVYISTTTGHILEILYDERGVIRIYNLSAKIPMNQGLSLCVSAFVCTNHFCITGSEDGYVRVWSRDFSRVYIEAKYDQSIRDLVSSLDQTRVCISTTSGSLNILNLVSKAHLNLMRSHTKSVMDMDYDDQRKQMISVAQDGTIRVWCFRTGKQLAEFTSERERPSSVVYAPNRQTFACGFTNGTIKIFDLETSTILHEVQHHNASITSLLYSHNGSYLLSSDADGDLCLSDTNSAYKLQKTITKTLIISKQGPQPLSISPDGKYTVYVGPTEFLVTMIETITLNQTLRIDLSSCTFMTNDQRTLTSAESALFARFAPNRQLLVATKDFKLLKFDSYSGRLLNIVDHVHKHSFDSLTVSSDSQYLITGGDGMLKFWDANLALDINFQSFVGHSGSVRRVFFTNDNMHVISAGDSILIWDVLAWNTSTATMPHDAQCIVPPQSVMTKILERVPVQKNSAQRRDANTARARTRTLSNSETITVPPEEKKLINQKLLAQKSNDENPSPSSIRRHFIPRINHSQLAKKRYVAPTNQERLQLQATIGYNGNARENLIWHPHTGLFAYTIGCNIIVENLNSSHQTILTGHTEEISTMALSNDATVLASAQCSIAVQKEEYQAKIIIWDAKMLHQKFCFHQAVHAVQSMAFSKDDRYLLTIGNYRKDLVSLWSTKDYSPLLHWQDHSSTSHINCLAWNPARPDEFSLGCSHGTIRFCTIPEQNDQTKSLLQVSKGQTQNSCDITSCVYLTSTTNLVLCATAEGLITCWNSRLCLCIVHWQADLNEICYMRIIKEKLLTGSSTGCLKLWNIEKLERNLRQAQNNDLNYGLTVEDEFELDDGIISGSFDNTFDMGIVGTSSGSLWYICWRTDRSKTRLVSSHTDQITGLITIEDSHLATSSLDGSIRVFQIEDRSEILRLNAHESKVTCITSWEDSPVRAGGDRSSSPSQSIIAGYEDGTLRIFSLFQGQIQSKIQPHISSIVAINVPLHSTISLSGASDGSIAISSLIQSRLLRIFNEHRGSTSICSLDSQKCLDKQSYLWLVASDDRRISLWKSNAQFNQSSFIDWLTCSSLNSINNEPSTSPSLARFIDTNLIIYTDSKNDKQMQIYHISMKQIIRTISSNQCCTCFDVSHSTNGNRLIAMGTKERLVKLKDYTQESFQDFLGSVDMISHIKLTNSNRLLITTSSNDIFIWKTMFN